MSGTDDSNKKTTISGSGRRPGNPHTTRTMPSLEVEVIRKQYEQLLNTGRRGRPGTVRLGPDPEDDEEDDQPTCDFPSEQKRLVKGTAGGRAIEREKVLASSNGAKESTPVVGPPLSQLDLLLESLSQETFGDETSPYLPRATVERFDGVMQGGTLELKVDPEWMAGVDESAAQSGGGDEDFSWLGADELEQNPLSNSYGLSEEEASRAFAEELDGLGHVTGDALIAVGRLAKLEASIVDWFVELGQAFRQLLEEVGKPDGAALRACLDPTGMVEDSDVLTALERWVENKHGAKFWLDDDGRRLKAVRLVGAYLVRKHGETLCRLEVGEAGGSETFGRLQALANAVKAALEERQRLIRQFFPGKGAVFATNFLVQRGLNARPGFFWSEGTCQGL